MRFGKVFICAVTAMLLLLAVLGLVKEQEPEDFLTLEITVGDRTETIRCHDESGTDRYYFFLPAYGELAEVRLRTRERNTYFLDDNVVEDGMTCAQVVLEQPYILREKDEVLGELIFVHSGGVGAMFVDVASGSMERIHEEKGKEESGKLRLYTVDGQLEHTGNILTIKGRGNSTWEEEKKSYSLELPAEADLLGMGSAEKWILLSNSLDASNLRNKIVYDFSKDFGLPYSPDSDWIDLYLNGEYAGLYLLCERNEVHPQRVAISGRESFLMAKDWPWRFRDEGNPYITTDSQAALRIYYADMDTETLESIWQSVENAILAEDGIDPVSGKSWQELIDAESWVKKYLIEEGFGNIDGGILSQFFYYDGSNGTGKVCAGPVWDYDLSFHYDAEHPEASSKNFVVNIPDSYGAPWPAALYRKADYYEMVVDRYEKQFLPLLETYLETVIPEYARRILPASRMNWCRWSGYEVEQATQELFRYMELRVEFLNGIWLEDVEYCFLDTRDLEGERGYYAVEKGDLPPSLMEYTSGDSGYVYRWYNTDTGEPFDLNEPVCANANLMLQYEPVPGETQQEEPVEETPPVQEEAEFPEGIPQEPIAQSRLAPLLVFLGMLALISLIGLYRMVRDRKQK